MDAQLQTDYRCGPVVIGTGIAGLLAALSLAPLPVVLVGTGMPGSSDLAQGGIAAATGSDDRPALHAEDTLMASSGLCDEKVVGFVTGNGADRIDLLRRIGVPFDIDRGTGALKRGREAAHQVNRVLHCNGDGTGKAVTDTLWRLVHEASHIQLLAPALAEDLIVAEGRVRGLVLRLGSRPIRLLCPAVVLATGGVGQLFSHTTNPLGVCGMGLGMGLRAGAVARDLEFVQFHPTAIDLEGENPKPLATEALRGEGAHLVNDRGHRFMTDIHQDAELAPRDVVARAVFREKQAGRSVYLDARQAVGGKFPDLFPTVHRLCLEHGLDPVADPIPVAPAAHYHMGGLQVDMMGRTSLNGLWACGEVACTGLHGANRLASNSLLEALVFAPVAAGDIRKSCQEGGCSELDRSVMDEARADPVSVGDVPAFIRESMYSHVSLIRHAEGLAQSLGCLSGLTPEMTADKNAQTAAIAIAAAAYQREESRGGHFRSDFPLSLEREEGDRGMRMEDVEAVQDVLAAEGKGYRKTAHV